MILRFCSSVWRWSLMCIWRVAVPLYLRQDGLRLGVGTRFYGWPIVSTAPKSEIDIGDGAIICSDSRFTALGVSHSVVLRTLRQHARISIGQDTGISGGSISAAVSVTIGRNCLIGADVMITDNDFHPTEPVGRRFCSSHEKIKAAPVVIEENVFVGARAVILKGSHIGKDAVIAACAVVSGVVPPGCIVAGVPARPVGSVYIDGAVDSA